MKNKIWIILLFISLILFFYIYLNNNIYEKYTSNDIKNNIVNTGSLKNNIANKLDSNKLCNEFIKDKNSDIGKIYEKYIDVSNNKIAKTDYNIINSIFINRTCNIFKNIDSYNYNLCNIIERGDIKKIENIDIPKGDKLFTLSYLTGINKCGDNIECNFYYSFFKKIKSNNLYFPTNISSARNVEFYAYKIQDPSNYKEKLTKLILEDCITNIGKQEK